MRRRPDPRRSIYTELAGLLLIAAVIAGLFFLMFNAVIDNMFYSYIDRSGYNERQRAAAADYLQQFVDENDISTENINELENFHRKKQVLMLEVSDGEHIIYDSEKIGEDLSDIAAELSIDDPSCFPLVLKDRSVIVSIEGSFGYELSSTATILNVVLTFVLFIVLFLLGFRAKIEYIKKLKDEIALLEGGGLDYEITVKGRDELAALALGLDDMRVSFKRQIEEAETLAATNQKMITEISHDLRTPLTAVMLYAEILQNSKNLPDEKKLEYLDKIVKKIEHMKDLSDHLLTYSAAPRSISQISAARSAKTVFYDEINEICSYLTEQDFEVVSETEWPDIKLCISDEAVSRITNNISSNIFRYAAKDQPVIVLSGEDEGCFCLSFSNAPSEVSHTDSRGIGVESIRSLMRELGGSCNVVQDEEHYEIALRFPNAE